MAPRPADFHEYMRKGTGSGWLRLFSPRGCRFDSCRACKSVKGLLRKVAEPGRVVPQYDGHDDTAARAASRGEPPHWRFHARRSWSADRKPATSAARPTLAPHSIASRARSRRISRR
jgi:hypothetical protein